MTRASNGRKAALAAIIHDIGTARHPASHVQRSVALDCHQTEAQRIALALLAESKRRRDPPAPKSVTLRRFSWEGE